MIMDNIKRVKIQLVDVILVMSAIAFGYLYSDYRGLHSHLAEEANSLNNTQFANQSGMIFNRVPKAGSETIWGLIDLLGKYLGIS
jgi:hypothetical protein